MKPVGLTVVEWHHLGDAVMALPFVRGAQAAGWEVSVCAAPGPAEVYRLLLPAERVGVFGPEKDAWWRGGEWAQWRRRMGADTAVCAWGDPRPHVWMKQAGYARRAGLPAVPNNCYAREAALLPPRPGATAACGRVLEAVCGPLLTDALVRGCREDSHHQSWDGLAQLLGFETDRRTPWLAVPVPQTAAVGPGVRWVVHPGGRLPWKHWPAGHWAELLRRLAGRKDLHTVLVQGRGIPRVEPLPAGQRVVECLTVAELAGVVGGAGGLVGLDSFPAHLAAALGKPAVVLFGEMPACWFAPQGPGVRLVCTPSAGRPLRWYRRHGVSLLRGIDVDRVEGEVGMCAMTNDK